MAVPKIIPYDVELRSVNPVRSFDRPKAYTNDRKSVEFQFKILDMTSIELNTATAITLVYMRDGSFFANPSTDVERVGNVFSYLLKENEGNHAGVAQIQLVVTIDDAEFASQLFEFEIINGLETKVAQEVMIYDWTTLTRDARAYIDQFVADELLRDAEFDNAQFDRNTAFVASQDARTLAFGTEQTNRGTAFTDEQNERTTVFNESESGRTTAENGRVTAEDGRVEAETDRVTEEGKRVTAESGRVTEEGKRVTAESGRVTAESARATAETNRAAAFTAFNTRLTAEETATANNKVSAVKGKTFADVDARFEDVEADTTMMGTNLVTNGDFSNGTTGWSASDSVNTVSANTLINTGNGAQTFPTAFADSAVQSAIGKKVYVCAQMRVTNANCSSMQVMIDGATAGDNQTIFLNNPVQNTWYKISGVLTQPSNVSGVIRLKLIHQYADSATANGKVMESKYIIAIDLTNVFGAGNEPTAEQMDGILAKFTNSWFDGTKNLFRANATLNKLMAVDARTEFEAKNIIAGGNTPMTFPTSGTTTQIRIFSPALLPSKLYIAYRVVSTGIANTRNTPYLTQSTGGFLYQYDYTNMNITTGLRSWLVTTANPINGIGWWGNTLDVATVVDNFVIIDLTATFGAGKEPTLAEMDRLMARFPNSWFDGVKPIQTIETLYQEKANKVQEAWITPTFLNGWAATNSAYSVGYMKDEMGFVHFRGAVMGTTNDTFAFTLPVGYRPKQQYEGVIIAGGHTQMCMARVTPTGSVKLTTSSLIWNSLEGITFRAEQ